jgi:NAD(P)-dependent dehydrogenase (short-subunit alcohol dehydrogenase family)
MAAASSLLLLPCKSISSPEHLTYRLIIVPSSLAAYTPFYSTYQGSKAPVEFFTKAASKEAMSRNILVNAIAPGVFSDSFSSNVNSFDV